MFNCGKDDLSEDFISFFNQMENVTTRNIHDYFDNSILKLKTFDLKPFSMLASSFQEPILLDADAVMMRSPEEMYDFIEYKTTGALFFIDRQIKTRPHNYAKWFHDILLEPLSQKVKDLPFYRNKASHYQESGVVIIDKQRAFAGLLATCRLNTLPDRQEMHSKTYGDKETFWIGFEMAQVAYEFYDDHAAIIATGITKRDGEERLCSHLCHVDHENRLLCLNDGIQENKNRLNSPPGNFRYVGNAGDWRGVCLHATDLREIHPEDQEILQRITALCEQYPKTAK